ncbi:MAG TPA: alpha/beta hydrolase [Propionibacteriaceae bacterium]|nr:alpha/beta hydrolase [Propionibacteriaceae bacterium]
MSTVGMLDHRFPYVRFGGGPEPLVVLTGLAFDNNAPTVAEARLYGWSMRRLAAGRTVTVLRRPRGLSNASGELSTADIADLYASVLADEPGPVDVLGLSTGGLIAQHLALRHPRIVRRLVLAVTGARIAEPGRRICQDWLVHVERRDWRALRATLAASAVDGRTAQGLARLLGGSRREPDPRDVADFEATVRADLQHDTTAALPEMAVPTLILGGKDDPFFPESVLRATAAAIPLAHLEIHAGGHGVPKHHSRWLQDHVTAFLPLNATGQ